MDKDCIYDDYLPRQDGYPYILRDGKKIYKHREVLESKLGRSIEEDKVALHTCLNRACINPEHLIEATPAARTAHFVALGNHSYGSDRPMAKMTEETAYMALTSLLKDGISVTEVARDLGVNPSQISRLKKGQAWKHVKDKYDKDRGDYE